MHTWTPIIYHLYIEIIYGFIQYMQLPVHINLDLKLVGTIPDGGYIYIYICMPYRQLSKLDKNIKLHVKNLETKECPMQLIMTNMRFRFVL